MVEWAREYIPKKSKFIDYSHKQITAIQDKLNHRPRKVLGYKTPYEVFFVKLHSGLMTQNYIIKIRLSHLIVEWVVLMSYL
jgi:hypothetical protein